MPTYKVENGSARAKAIKVYGGSEVVKAGKSATVEDAREMSKDEIEDFAHEGVKITVAGKAKPSKSEPKADKE